MKEKPINEKLLKIEQLSKERRMQRRSFLRVSTLVGGGIPLVTTLAPTEARAMSSGS